MLHHQSFQPSVSPQAHQQALAPVLSSRRALAELNPAGGPERGQRHSAAPRSVADRRTRARIPVTNREALEALKRSSDEAERRALRDQLVRNNLPLVYAITARMGRTQALPLEDLRQVGSLGLLRAIDAFEPARGRTLSSFAVPYIRGAIQQELRDRASLMRIPRPLWELRRRATVLQDRRRRLGQPQLAPAQLAEALNCSACQVVEALQVGAVVEMRSLDAPTSAEGAEEATGRSLLELLPDPASLVEPYADAGAPLADDLIEALFRDDSTGSPGGEVALKPWSLTGMAEGSEPNPNPSATAPTLSRGELAARPQAPTGWPGVTEWSWLQQRMQRLTPLERQLIEGHVCLGRSWAELGRELQLHPRRAQRRTVALLSRLAAEAQRWRESAADPVAPA